MSVDDLDYKLNIKKIIALALKVTVVLIGGELFFLYITLL